jgi:uncharacterized DUF497 family protein
MAVNLSEKVRKKLKDKHSVSETELQEAFNNRTGKLLMDTREDHQSDPQTMWFVACTNHRRLLKVCFIQRGDNTHIRTAYSANPEEVRIYRKYGKPSDF